MILKEKKSISKRNWKTGWLSYFYSKKELNVLLRQKEKLDFPYLRFFSEKEEVLKELEELIEKLEAEIE